LTLNVNIFDHDYTKDNDNIGEVNINLADYLDNLKEGNTTKLVEIPVKISEDPDIIVQKDVVTTVSFDISLLEKSEISDDVNVTHDTVPNDCISINNGILFIFIFILSLFYLILIFKLIYIN
jgi:hypothetical protein